MQIRQMFFLRGFNLVAAFSALLSLIYGSGRLSQPVSTDASDRSGKAEPAAVESNGNVSDDVVKRSLPPLFGERRVTQSIWGDPLENSCDNEASEGEKQGNGFARSPGTQTEGADQRISRFLDRARRPQILPVIVEGGDFSSVVARRINDRHAVEYALAIEGFTPVEEDTMCMVSVRWSPAFILESGNGRPLDRSFTCDVPLMIYERKQVKSKDRANRETSTSEVKGEFQPSDETEVLLVCWLDHRFLGHQPLDQIEKVVRQLVTCDVLLKSVVSIIGPVFSRDLELLTEEALAAEDRIRCLKRSVSDLRIYSAHPTTMPEAEKLKRLRELIHFNSTIGTDDQLASAMFDELWLRKRQHGKIILISQSGATSPTRITQQVAKKLQSRANVQLLQLRYLRNIQHDHRGSGSPDERKSDHKPSEEVSDYFDRQLDSLAGSDINFSAEEVSAIVVIGDDEFDRVELIKKLRPSFPNATLFTHDLHAAYFRDPDVRKITRGLVVVTRGDIVAPLLETESGDDLNRVFRPAPGVIFRDIYQTSVYTAVREAISGSEQIERGIKVYEIGRTSPVDLDQSFTSFQILKSALAFVALGTIVLLLMRPVLLHGTEASGSWKQWGIPQQIVQFLQLASPSNFAHSDQFEITMKAAKNEDELREKTLSATALFRLLFTVRIELAIAAVASAFVWRDSITEVHLLAVFLQFLYVCLISLTVVMIFLDVMPDWVHSDEKTNADSLEENRRIGLFLSSGWSWKPDMVCFRLFLPVFLLFTLIAVIMDQKDKSGLLHEPLLGLSGISLWPALFFFSIVVVMALVWLYDQQLSPRAVSNNTPMGAWWSLPQALRAELPYVPTPDESIAAFCPRQISDAFVNAPTAKRNSPTFLARARLAMYFLLLSVVILQLPQIDSLAFFPNWSMFPLPPARGGIELAAGMFLGTFTLLLSILVAFTAYLKVTSFSETIEAGIEKLQRLLSPKEIVKLDDQKCPPYFWYECCRQIQDCSERLMSRVLQSSCLILLGFAAARFPLLESWPVNSSILIAVAGVPVLFCLAVSLMLRGRCRRFREYVLELLECRMDRFANPTNSPPVDGSPDVGYGEEMPYRAEDDPKSKETRERMKDIRDQIKGMERGAFGGIGRDPVLGSVLFFVTAVGPGPGIELVNFIFGLT